MPNSVSQPSKNAKQPFLFWCGIAMVTLPLVCGLYWCKSRASAAEASLAKARLDRQDIEKQHSEWSELQKERLLLQKKITEEETAIHTQFASFSRFELDDALSNAIRSADPEKAFIFANSTIGGQGWLWVPEGGHQLEFRFAVENLNESDVTDGNFDLTRDVKFDLTPGRLHSFKFSIKSRYRTDDALLRLQFNEEVPISMVIRGNVSGTQRMGSKGYFNGQLGIVSYDCLHDKNLAELMQRGTWHLFGKETYSLRRSKANRKLENEDLIKISCQAAVTSSGPIYIRKSWGKMLAKQKIKAEQIRDSNSPWHEWFELYPNRK